MNPAGALGVYSLSPMIRMFPKTLQTKRLRLRPPRVGDAKAIFQRYAQDTEVTRFLQWAPHRSVTQTECFLNESERFWREGTRFPWAIIDKANRSVIGMIELRLVNSPDSEGFNAEDFDAGGRRAEIGYVLARDVWGQGYMTEVLRAVIEMALSDGRLTHIRATCDAANLASLRVLEKADMSVENQCRQHSVHPNLGSGPRDCITYVIGR